MVEAGKSLEWPEGGMRDIGDREDKKWTALQVIFSLAKNRSQSSKSCILQPLCREARACTNHEARCSKITHMAGFGVHIYKAESKLPTRVVKCISR